MTQIDTDRLCLRMFRSEDFEAYARLLGDPLVMRYIADGRPLRRNEAWRNLALILGHWQLRGFGLWAVEERASGRLVGRIGFFQPEGWPGFEIGWLLSPSVWGRGYATEGARAALAHAFEELGAEHVISLIHPENEASVRVAERIGERLEGSTEVAGQVALVYGVDRRPWQRGSRPLR